MNHTKMQIRDYLRKFDNIIKSALNEDMGSGDRTTNAIVSKFEHCDFIIALKEDAVVCGMPVVLKVFDFLSAKLEIEYCVEDGEYLSKGSILLKASGLAKAILSGERTALNFLQRMSGIATLTRKYAEKISGLKTKILDTRKTTPVLRAFEKYAVMIGGGVNHRYNLNDGILIKENHLKIVSKYYENYITYAVKKAKRQNKKYQVEVEVMNFKELKEAVEAGADRILLDNMSVNQVRKAVQYVKGRAKLEASGGITEKNIRKYAETGVDYISVGALTHSFKSVDITLRVF